MIGDFRISRTLNFPDDNLKKDAPRHCLSNVSFAPCKAQCKITAMIETRVVVDASAKTMSEPMPWARNACSIATSNEYQVTLILPAEIKGKTHRSLQSVQDERLVF